MATLQNYGFQTQIILKLNIYLDVGIVVTLERWGGGDERILFDYCYLIGIWFSNPYNLKVEYIYFLDVEIVVRVVWWGPETRIMGKDFGLHLFSFFQTQ